MTAGASTHELVLVAEDDDEMCAIITRALRLDGYDVLAARDGASLFAALRASCRGGRVPALLVSDVQMPGMTGIELAAAIRAEKMQLPVLLISAFADDRLVRDAARAGASFVLSKPFDLDDLRTVVMHLLRAPRS